MALVFAVSVTADTLAQFQIRLRGEEIDKGKKKKLVIVGGSSDKMIRLCQCCSSVRMFFLYLSEPR